MKLYVLMFIVFSLLYMVFEVIFNAITFPQLNEMLKKKKWSMFGFVSAWMIPFGGIATLPVILIYQIPLIHEKVAIIPWMMLISMIVITAVEFGGGYLLNLKLKLNIWDYSNTKITIAGKTIPLNFKGQIDIWHSLGWFGMGWVICVISDFIKFLNG